MSEYERVLKEVEKRNRQTEKTNKAVTVLLIILVLVNFMAYLDKIILFARYALFYLN